MAEVTIVRLKPAVHFCEFPFGVRSDPSMREFMGERPQENQDKLLEYLRSGHVLALPMGASLTDWFDRPHKANPLIDGRIVGGVTPLGDGVWFWPAGLIHFVEKYNVRLPDEFTRFAAEQDWRVTRPLDEQCRYTYSYFSDEQ
jgi:hypothetical protein